MAQIKHFLWLKIGFILISITSLYIAFFEGSKMPVAPPRFVILDTPRPKSFDPLEADKSININMMRMLYLRPIEISRENTLTSTVLEKFLYNGNTNTIDLFVSSGLRYSDGQAITTNDVVLAVLRMAMTRPEFPVIRDIKGIHEWAKTKSPLTRPLDGITISGQHIQIQLTKKQRAPLFRLTLELFSIIPTSCVDLNTGKLKCETPPFSGFYTLDSLDSSVLHFKKRNAFQNLKDIPSEIFVSYPSPNINALKAELDIPGAILYGADLRIKDKKFGLVDLDLSYKFLPAAQFLYLAINPNIKPFDNPNCRRAFAKVFRKKVSEAYPELLTSSSIFTSLVPGYLSEKNFSFSSEENFESCIKVIKESHVPWSVSDTKDPGFSDQIMALTMNEIDPEQEPNIVALTERENLFTKGKGAFYVAMSGFWAQDPTGDLAMFFTPELHQNVQFSINNTMLKEELSHLNFFSEDLTSDLQKINKTLFSEALINVFGHSRKFFASKDPEILNEIPQAVSSPAFYQVVNTAR